MHIEILRDRVEPEGVFGTLSIDGERICVTCEQPWRNNQKGISCIPAGDYALVPHDSTKHPNVVAFVNPALRVFHHEADAPKDGGSFRAECLIHNANDPDQLHGCVAPGASVKFFKHQANDGNGGPQGWGVDYSLRTMERLRARWKDRKNMTATIKWTEAMRPAQ